MITGVILHSRHVYNVVRLRYSRRRITARAFIEVWSDHTIVKRPAHRLQSAVVLIIDRYRAWDTQGVDSFLRETRSYNGLSQLFFCGCFGLVGIDIDVYRCDKCGECRIESPWSATIVFSDVWARIWIGCNIDLNFNLVFRCLFYVWFLLIYNSHVEAANGNNNVNLFILIILFN